MTSLVARRVLTGCVGAFIVLGSWLVADSATAAPLDVLETQCPRTVAALETVDMARLQQAAALVDEWAFQNTQLTNERRGPSPLTVVQTALNVKARVDALLDQVLALRTGIVTIAAEPPDDPARRDAARGFLRAATVLIDLSGRLNLFSTTAR